MAGCEQPDKLMQRLLRLVDYSTDRYIHHRNRGEYQLAVERLIRMDKLVALIERVERHGVMIDPLDWVNVRLVHRHVGAMLPAL